MKPRVVPPFRVAIILEGLRQGLSNREIAEQIGTTEATIKVYLSAIFKQRGVKNRTQLAMLELQNRIKYLEHELTLAKGLSSLPPVAAPGRM